MELLYYTLPIAFLTFTLLLFTREKTQKMEYFKRTSVLFVIGLIASCIAFPLFGPIFGFSSILLNAVVLGTLVEFKEK